ncbi:phage baseplate assembly protein V [Pseudomonas sp. PDM04]|uniref:phage baseplate assembly protein V n=1 Tax=Pseudomonas sp. PDM04 TaxID=2769296 RepID=UPI001781F39D|nr:phage baseplate assembly protein V [Pseudomonas sp. PDM04]MBD9439035.1 phage baseplate assembly protein V [Pseudomonas sp. PDM04]
MSYPSAEHDRMIAAMLMPCAVVGVDLAAAMVRVSNGEWTSAWVRWHSLAAGMARHWRAPSIGEQGVLFNPSGQAGMGTFIPGLYGNAGAQPDNRDHVEAWRFDDGGSLVYDWQAKTYTITLPSGQVITRVGSTESITTDNAVTVTTTNVTLIADVEIQGPLRVTGAVELVSTLHAAGNITSDGQILDAGGNSNHHTH